MQYALYEASHDRRPWPGVSGSGWFHVRYSPRGSVPERVHPLHDGQNKIGRAPDSDILFEDCLVSRKHCIIEVDRAGVVALRDVGSRNGTLVNGVRVNQPVALGLGDEVLLCERRLVLVDPAALPARSAGAAASDLVPGSLEWAEEHGYLDGAYEPDTFERDDVKDDACDESFFARRPPD